jgi:hypothetical protein
MTMNFISLLTEEEKEEILKYPPGLYHENINIPLRKEIAKKAEKFFNENDDMLTDEFKEIYEKFPRWKFYTDKKNNSAIRIFGLYCYSDGTWCAYACTAHLVFTHQINDVFLDDLVPIDNWTELHLVTIESNINKGAFIDPLGWSCFI